MQGQKNIKQSACVFKTNRIESSLHIYVKNKRIESCLYLYKTNRNRKLLACIYPCLLLRTKPKQKESCLHIYVKNKRIESCLYLYKTNRNRKLLACIYPCLHLRTKPKQKESCLHIYTGWELPSVSLYGKSGKLFVLGSFSFFFWNPFCHPIPLNNNKIHIRAQYASTFTVLYT